MVFDENLGGKVIISLQKMARSKKKVRAAAAIISALAAKRRRRRRQENARQPRSMWCRNWISKRKERGAYHCLLQELASSDLKSYKNFLRMDQAGFQELLEKVKPQSI